MPKKEQKKAYKQARRKADADFAAKEAARKEANRAADQETIAGKVASNLPFVDSTGNYPVQALEWDTKDNGGEPFTRERIQTIVLRAMKGLRAEEKDKDQRIQISTLLYYDPPGVWRKSQDGFVDVVNPGTRPPLHKPGAEGYDSSWVPEPEDGLYAAFKVFVKRSPKGGGCSSSSRDNDCFFNCLVELGVDKFLPHRVRGWTPAEFKKWVGLGDNLRGLITLEHVRWVEEKTLIAFFVRGDEVYVSQRPTSARQVHLLLRNSHFTVDTENHTQPRVRGCSAQQKELVVFEPRGSTNRAFCGSLGECELSREEIARARKMPVSAPYNYIMFQPAFKGQTLAEFWEFWNTASDELSRATNGAINIVKCNGVRRAALKFFFENQRLVVFEPLKDAEAQWVLDASRGAMMWAARDPETGRCYSGPADKYDFVSFYPSIMCDSRFLLPFKEGQFKRITTQQLLEEARRFLPKNLSLAYGIYHCVIAVPPPQGNRHLFRVNPSNHYTHFDVLFALERGWEVQMVEGAAANALVYDRSCLTLASHVFQNFVEPMFKLKRCKKLAAAKAVLNILWGALTQKRTFRVSVPLDAEEPHQLQPGTVVASVGMVGDSWELSVMRRESPFEFNEGRIKPFLMAKARDKINRVLLPVIDRVVRVHTDGFLVQSSEEALDFGVPTGTDLGQLKFEGHCENCVVHHVNRVEGVFVLPEL